MEPMKHSYDVLGEKALDRLNAISPPANSELPRNTSWNAKDLKEQLHGAGDARPPKPKRDLYTLLRDNSENDPVLSQLWNEINTTPPWVDWDQLARGQDCFYRYGGVMLTGLAFQSLLGGMGAARVVETLARTGGFSTKVARHRLYETTQHILQCTRSLDSIKPGGDGFASSIRIRLLHAAVRQRIMKLAKQRPEYYNVEEWGIPINDLDCIGTIGTFSATLIWLSLPRQGIWMRPQETEDYIALWRYIAYLTGTPSEHFETADKAKKMMEVLMLYEIAPSETSKTLASNVIACLEAQPPSFASRSFLEVNSRWLNGHELSDALGLGRPTWYYWILMTGQCVFFMGLCYTYRAIPSWDRKKIAALRRIFWTVIVESKHGLGEETAYEFKYIPEMSKRTEREQAERSGIQQPGIERRNLKAFGIGCAFIGVAGYLSLKVGAFIARKATGFWIG